MAEVRNVAVLVGSLRKASLNRQLAHAPAPLQLKIVEIGALPLYDQDHEAEPPPAVQAFKPQVAASDAVLFVTPEYNRSVPGVLKNAIDHASRPYGQSAWAGNPAAVIALSPGAIGDFGANHHLRLSLVFLDMPTMAQPEAYVGDAAKLFDGQGGIAVAETREFLGQFLAAFAGWIARNASAR